MDILIESLRNLLGPEAVLSDPGELLVYECDGLPQHKHPPRAVVFPRSTEQVAEVMRVLNRFSAHFTPRGAGTGLSGGAVAVDRGVVIELARMRKILAVDPLNRLARVQTGVVNLHVSQAVAHHGLHYIPDPSSQPTCTIGGNIAENAGGIHCLKYGTTTDHVLSACVVLGTGEVVELESAEIGVSGYDLLGVFVGSEGTFGIATEATLRLAPIPPAVRTLLAEFPNVDDASHAVSAIIAAGVMPAALEMMDREIIRAVEASVFAAGLPPDAGAALLIELDGIEAGLDEQADHVKGICLHHGARSCRLAHDENERKKLWAARKGAFGAVGRIAPDSMIQDAVVPRSSLPQVMRDSYAIAERYNLILANVFHAGDGNLHPFICFDSRSAEEVERVKEAGRELMEVCVRAGGSITGEHGVGLDKRDYLPLIFSEADMNVMLSVRAAFDPSGLCNPGKIVPVLRGCGEARAIATSPPAGANGNAHQLAMAPQTSQTAASPAKISGATPASRIAAIVGDDYVEEQDVIIAKPASVDEIIELVKLAAVEGWVVRPAGFGQTSNANRGAKFDLVISTARLNRILEHEPADLIARAEAGALLERFNNELSINGQWLPLDPPNSGLATLGGVVATNSAGPLSCAFGPPRRHVIGMKVVLADGSLIKAGGRVVKNVAGYDLCKLFSGSRGTLGIIAELNFKLRPQPPMETTVQARGKASGLISAGQRILESKLFPIGLELLSPVLTSTLNNEGIDAEMMLLVRFAGNDPVVKFQISETVKILCESRGISSAENMSADAQLWRRLAVTSAKLPAQSRATVLPSRLAETIALLPPQMLWHAGLADGRIQLFGDFEQDEVLEKIEAEKRGDLQRQRVVSELSQRIKRQLDPSGVFVQLIR